MGDDRTHDEIPHIVHSVVVFLYGSVCTCFLVPAVKTEFPQNIGTRLVKHEFVLSECRAYVTYPCDNIVVGFYDSESGVSADTLNEACGRRVNDYPFDFSVFRKLLQSRIMFLVCA